MRYPWFMTFGLMVAGVVAGRADTTYSTSTSFMTAAGVPMTLLNFNGTVPANGTAGSDGQTYGAGPNGAWTASLTDAGVIFAADEDVFYVAPADTTDASFHNSDYLDWQGNYPTLGTLTVTLPYAVEDVGFNLGAYASSGNAKVTVDGHTYTVSFNGSAYSYFGVITTTPFTTFTIVDNTNYATMDNFSFGPAVASAAPDGAATVGGLGFGLVLLAGLRKRRVLNAARCPV